MYAVSKVAVLLFLVYQNTALFSTFRPSSVMGVTSQLVSIC